MKVIFLDIDGVLNSNFWKDEQQKEISDTALIDAGKIVLLRELVEKTGAKLVLHSGWRFWFDQQIQPLREEAALLRQMLGKKGLSITALTPDHATKEIRRTKKFSQVKAGEILSWLKEHPEVEQWIVLDDLELHNDEVAAHQIKTDASVGLTKQDVEDAEALLNVQVPL